MQEKHIVHINTAKCIGCGICANDCPDQNIELVADKAQTRFSDCLMCAHCVAICPKNAVEISNFDDAPEELSSFRKVDGDALLQHIKRRRSARHFKKDKVPAELLSKLLQAGQYTPSASNRQEVSYVVIQERLEEFETLAVDALKRGRNFMGSVSERLKNLYINHHFFFKGAPLVIVVKAPNIVDGALAAASIELTAQAYGLGVLYSGFFSVVTRFSPQIKEMLELTSDEKIAATLVIGYPTATYLRTAPKEKPKVIFR